MSAYVKTAAPHFSAARSVPGIYWGQFACLMPLLVISFLVVGWDAVRVFSIAIACAFLTEWFAGILLGRAPSFRDGSNALSAFLFAMILSPNTPSWVVALSFFAALLLGRELFGGLGANFLSIPLLARLFVLLAGSDLGMAENQRWHEGFIFQTLASFHGQLTQNMSGIWAAFLGTSQGSLGSMSGLFVFVMGCVMIFKKYVKPEIPLLYILTISIFGLLQGRNPGAQLLSPEILFTAFFLLADSVVMPSTKMGKRLFTVLAAIGVALVSAQRPYVESVCVILLLVSLMTPWLEVWIRPAAAYRRTLT